MCRDRNNFPELGLAVNQLKKRTNNLLADIQEWRHYSVQQNQGQVAEKLEFAEDKLYEALGLLEETLGQVNQSPTKDNDGVTINIIRK